MSRSPLTGALRRGGARLVLRLGIATVGLLTAVAALALLARPELWAAGPLFVIATLLSGAGTAASAAPLATSLLLGFLLARQLEEAGTSDAIAALGYGAELPVRALAPLVLLLTALSAFATCTLEPRAWTALHDLKGSSALSAATLARLAQGEVVSLPGGAVVERDGLHAARGDLRLTAESLRPSGAGWSVQGLEAETPTSRWRARTVALSRLSPPASPRSPLAQDLGPLWTQTASPDRAVRARARRVLHRRLALSFAAPLLTLLGWGLGRRPSRGPVALLPLLTGLGFFAALRASDALSQAGLLHPVLAGWLPLLLLAVAARALR